MSKNMLNITKYSFEYLSTTDDNKLLPNSTESLLPYFSKTSRAISNTSAPGYYLPLILTEMISSIICLVLSIIIYSILPEFKNVHGKNLISLSSCLLATYILLSLDIVLYRHVSYSFCFTISVLNYAAFLSIFFWTNVMAYDIWSNVTRMKVKCEVTNSSRKYAKYSAYAWSGTVLTSLPAVVFETRNIIAGHRRSGVTRCLLSDRTAFLYYFYVPVGFLLLGNMTLFCLTIRKLWLIKKTTEILQIKQEQNRLILYLKLFFVMGVTWFTAFLPRIIQIVELYIVSGILMALHGVCLFVIFTLRKSVLRQLKEKIFDKLANQRHSTS